MDTRDTSEWRIEIVAVEVGEFQNPKSGQFHPGKKWLVHLSDGTGTYAFNLVYFGGVQT
jgi:hypothetical protein